MRAADNPFAVHRVLQQRYRLSAEDWTRVLDRLAALRYRAAIVGPKGSGKTTLLEDLAARLSHVGHRTRFLRWDASHRALPDLSDLTGQDLLLCDGAEQLTWVDWCRLRLRATRLAGMIVTSHREGLLPTVHRCETSASLLMDLTERLGVPITPAQSRALYVRYDGNIREALRALYDECSVAYSTR